MSDSGRIISECKHGDTSDTCVFCERNQLREEVASLKTQEGIHIKLINDMQQALGMSVTDSMDGDPVAWCEGITKELERLRTAYTKQDEDICQTLGQALERYPWYCDDQANFPGSTKENGVCVGEHVAESLAAEAAEEIKRLRRDLKAVKESKYY